MAYLNFFIVIIIFFVNVSYCLSQGISKISIIDNTTYPLLSNDNGISIKYKTESCGTISAYLSQKNDIYVLFSDRKEFYGDGKIIISNEKLYNWFGCYNNSLSVIKFEMTHVSCRWNKYSQKSINLSLNVYAPYGCTLKELPNKPELHSTNHKIKKVNPLSVLGIIAGSGIVVIGVDMLLKEEDNAWIVGAAGLLITLWSRDKYNYYVPNQELNNYYERQNNQILDYWKMEYRQVENFNNLVKNSFKIKINLR